MTSGEFDKVLNRRLQAIREVLALKQKEYSSKDDRLHNFKTGARIQNTNQAATLRGYMTKQLSSVFDLIEKYGNNEVVSEAVADEKIGDVINYMILLEAIFKEHRTANASCGESKLKPGTE